MIKLMTLFSALFLLILILVSSFAIAAADYDLRNYPYPFVFNGEINTKLVIGQNAATSDTIGAVDVATSLIAASEATNIVLGGISSIFDKHMALFDVDAPELGSEYMIVIGGPCANAVAAELLDYPIPCNKGFKFGKAIIKYFPEKKVLLVAGYDAQETLAASYLLSDYEDSDLKGEAAEVTIAGQALLAINPVIT